MTNNTQNELKKELFPFIVQNWHSPLALLFLAVIELLVLLPYCWQNFGEGISIIEWIAIFTFVGGSALIWVLTRKYPKNTRNKVGIIVAVITESRKEYLRLRSDLILRFKEVIRTKARVKHF